MSDTKVFSLADLKAHQTDKSCWLVVHGKVYDVTDFLEEHPGGYDIIITSTGKDATQDFEEIGHSKSAKKLLEKYLIGAFEGGDSAPAVSKVPPPGSSAATQPQQKGAATRAFHVVLPLLILLAALALNFYFSSSRQ
ncbi:Cytochrome b5 [Tetrabaena socialis]|uniref:Cytochrome b5 n=1 Tax=Tetrabaena socialis TaxID=47790 RepID=A0A2J7ZZG0_9CHLO|nr:Cytochrome b5 [Tetrabaena socialis]|eukprot:PNH05652.1 Cytochrome b5 [Tetrabaena socialis]